MVGFDVRDKDSINQSKLCPVCHLILREPFQLGCGHRQCKTCVEKIEGDIITCPECLEQTQKHEILLDRGFRNDMKQLQIACSLCEWLGVLKDYEVHLSQVHPNPVCEFCEEIFNSTIELNEHKQKKCMKIIVPCILKDYGCLNSVRRTQLPEHYLSDIHQKALLNAIRHFTVESSNEQHARISDMDIGTGKTGLDANLLSVNANTNLGMEEVQDTMNILTSGIQFCNDDIQQISTDSVRLQTLIQFLACDIEAIKLKMQEQDAWSSGFQLNQEILQQNVASLKQRMDDVQHASYDGTLIWKITNVREKMRDAQSERQKSIYSPTFYSSPNGYKMRARLYLNGDGDARGTHMSLYFVLMRGLHDAVLKFPFNYKVIFCLYDQTSQQQHKFHRLEPNIKFDSFQRPRSDMNIARGIPKFFPLSILQQEGNPYVRDDTMFIKVMVDFDDMPKTLLSYALTLNPGIPMHTQQIMIKQEVERRAQQ